MTSITKKELFKWEPFTYICEGLNGEKIEFGGFFPIDVRAKCPFILLKIHGPIKLFKTAELIRCVIHGENVCG
jgi:hypothetical protein